MLSNLLSVLGPAVSGGTRLAGGLRGLLSGNTAALPTSLINLLPTALSATGSLLGGSVSGGLSALGSGVAPGLASGLSVTAAPAALAAYIASKAIAERLNAPKKQGAKQLAEAQRAYQALPHRLEARAGGAGVLNQLGALDSPDALREGLGLAHRGIQADLESTPLKTALDVVIEPGRFARSEFPRQAPPQRPELIPLRDAMTGPLAADNYVAQLLTTDAASRRGVDATPYQTWTSEGTGAAGGMYDRDTGEFITADGTRMAQAEANEAWTWDDDFLNNAVSLIGGQLGIDPAKLQRPEVTEFWNPATQQYEAADFDTGAASRTRTVALTPADLPGWEAGNYGQALDQYLRSLDPGIVERDAYKRYQSLPGLASLFG